MSKGVDLIKELTKDSLYNFMLAVLVLFGLNVRTSFRLVEVLNENFNGALLCYGFSLLVELYFG